MRKLICLLPLVVLLAVAFGVCCAEGQIYFSGDYSYSIREEGALRIEGYTGNAENLSVPAMLDGYAVAEIGHYVFSYEELKSIVIPEGIVEMGWGAIEYCPNLLSVQLPASLVEMDGALASNPKLETISIASGNSVYAVVDNVLIDQVEKKLVLYPAGATATEYTIPKGIVCVGEHAFAEAGYLQSVIIPAGVEKLEYGAFSGCSNLKNIVISEGLAIIGSSCFDYCSNLQEISLPSSLERIEGNPFEGCNNLKKLNVSANIGGYAFAKGCLLDTKEKKLIVGLPTLCSGEVVVPEGVVSIGNYAFADCELMTSIVFPDSMTTIERYAFISCAQLAKVYFPKSVQELGDSVFMGCDALKQIILAENHPVFSIIDGVLFDKSGKLLICYPGGKEGEKYTIPAGVETIEEHAFDNGYLQKVVFSNTVKEIRSLAFNGCFTMKEVVLNEGLERIETNAFSYCGSILKVDIPDSVIEIGDEIFEGYKEGFCLVVGKGTAAEQYAIDEQIPYEYRKGNAAPAVLKIIEQPVDVAVAMGENARVTVKAEGDGLTYTWYGADANSNRFRRSSAVTGNSYSIEMNEKRNGRRVYCLVADAYGNSAITNTVTLSGYEKLGIIAQPVGTTVFEGEKAVVTVQASGEGLSYEWYAKDVGGTKYHKSETFTGNTYSVKMDETRSGREIYCVITDAHGNSVKTATVILKCAIKVEITRQPQNAEALDGEAVSVSVKARGDGLTYAWYTNDYGEKNFYLSKNATGATYSVKMNEARNGRRVYCVLTDAYGNTDTTDTVTLSMKEPELIPVDVKSGEVIITPDYEMLCPFTVDAGSGSNYYIYLDYLYPPTTTYDDRLLLDTAKEPYENDMAFYVAAGETVSVQVPIGVYELYYASGDVFYGEELKFGKETVYSRADTNMDFYSTLDKYKGHTVTLYKVQDGNMKTENVSAGEFPG